MKAAVLEQLNQPLNIYDLEIPCLDYGQVLVRVHCSTICGAQLREISGAKGEDKYLPHLLGHEGGGVVEKVGGGVQYVQEGDHVVLHWRKGRGIDCRPPKYNGDGIVVGGGWVTTFNDYAIVSENRLTKVNHDLPFPVASLMGCAVTTALGLVNNEAQLKIGESIVVAGCGGVGLNIIQGSAMVSATPIVAVDCISDKLATAYSFGATHTVNSRKIDLDWSLQQIFGKSGIDVFVDCTGNPEVIATGYRNLTTNGRLILVGQPMCGVALNFPNAHCYCYSGKKMMDSQGGLTNPTLDIPRYERLYLEGKLKLDELITDTFSLEEINTAINIAKSGYAGRVALRMNDE